MATRVDGGRQIMQTVVSHNPGTGSYARLWLGVERGGMEEGVSYKYQPGLTLTSPNNVYLHKFTYLVLRHFALNFIAITNQHGEGQVAADDI